MQPLTLAFRSLRRAPVFSILVVLSLGLGVGACTVVFALIQSVYGTALPYPDADRLVEIWSTETPASWQRVDLVPLGRLRAWMDQGFQTLDPVATKGSTTLVLDGADPQRVEGDLVSGRFFEVMGVPTLIGRWLLPADDRPDADPAVVVSESLWRERFGGEKSALGTTVSMSGETYTIVGVMPTAFDPGSRVWLPAADDLARGAVVGWTPIGRLRAGVTLGQASTEVHERAAAEIAADSTLYGGYGAVARPIIVEARSIDTSTLWVLVVTASGILMLAVTNVMGLFLLRAAERGRSAGIRLTLGASSWQLGRGLLIESILLGAAASTVAVILSVWWGDLVRVWVGALPATASTSSVNPMVVGFATILSLMIAIAAGSEPLRHLVRLDLRRLLAGTTTTSLGPRQRISRNVMVGTQIALAMSFASIGVVLTIAYQRFGAFDIGYDAERVVTALPDYAYARGSSAPQPATMGALVDRIAQSPGVESATLWRGGGQRFPPTPETNAVFDGGVTEVPVRLGLYRYYDVGPDFFETLGIPIVAGRDFGSTDGAGSAGVGIVSQSGARTWWPGQDPIGRQLKLGAMGEWITIVGVAGDAADLSGLGREFSRGVLTVGRAHMPLLYRPIAQSRTPPIGWVNEGNMVGMDGIVIGARTLGEPAPVAATIKAEMGYMLPQLPLSYVGTLQDWQVNAWTGRRLLLYRSLLVSLAASAFFLSLLGVAGIVADGVVRRTREIGIRKALGARARDVTAALAREGLLTAVVGVGAGTLLVFGVAELASRINSLRTILSGGTFTDWRVLTGVGVAVVLTSLVTSCVCTVRANKMEASVALRSE